MRLKIEWSINNELRVTRAIDKFVPKSFADNADCRRRDRRNHELAQGLEAERVIDRATRLFPVEAPASTWDAVQYSLLGEPTIINPSKVVYNYPPVSFPAVERGADGRFHRVLVPLAPLERSRDRALGIIAESQRSPKAHSTWGATQRPKAFTRYARGHILQCGAAIDKLGLKDASSLLTLTLPGSCHEAYDALARWSGWIVNRQLQAVRRYMKNRPVYWFFCWEWQQRGALHQHWCIAGDSYKESRHLSYLVRDQWYKCLKEIGQLEKIDMFMHSSRRRTWINKPDKWNWNEQKVEKSVARYFSKYASKEAPKPDAASKRRMRNCYYPSRWQGSSSNIKKVIKSHHRIAEYNYLSPVEAMYLENLILEEVYNCEVLKAYEFEFEVQGNEGVVFAQGTTKILYVSDTEYARFAATLDDWIGTPTERNQGVSALQWAINLRREREAIETGSAPIVWRKIGTVALSY